MSLINFQDLWWMSTSLLHIRISNILLPKSKSSPILYSVWERRETILSNPGRGKFNGIQTTIFKDLNRIDGQPMELEWKIFSGLTTLGILNQTQQMMGELRCEPENLTGRIIFMSMSDDIVWDSKRSDEIPFRRTWLLTGPFCFSKYLNREKP